MTVPDWWGFLLLGLAAWRTFQLLAFDKVLNWPRNKLLNLPTDWEEGEELIEGGRELPENYRLGLAQWIVCPYCAGAWIAAIWWAAFQITEHWTLVAASFVALFVAPIVGHKLLAKEEDK